MEVRERIVTHIKCVKVYDKEHKIKQREEQLPKDIENTYYAGLNMLKD